MQYLDAVGRRLEYYWTAGHDRDGPTLVFLHEGLGSAGLWRDFPALMTEATDLTALVYSRYGYGGSDVLEASRGIDYMHAEALEVLPAIRDALDLDDTILVGHSDGGSIAAIHAGAGQWPVRGLILEAPHFFVEDESISGIEDAKIAYESTDLPTRIACRHTDGDKTFRGWNDIWLSPVFRDWNIEEYLPGITCPTLVIQGVNDEYGTEAQLAAIGQQSSGSVDTVMVPECGHAPHHDAAEGVLDVMSDFVATLTSSD
ncbi:MAG: alpha/beta hydrolase [Alphaproteobacteria bacterium]|nr:alpha/beta hydrolase [Alphaproteobacteria bacterium]HCO99970.1 alpha/beta hydrolase [Rhodospirillaceae bacterium]